jgi:microcystin-dependent protein
MSQPYIGEIRLVPYNFAPAGWAFCNGALMDIAQNSALFNLIGTTYGGDGQSTFALPNLQSRIPVHQGPGFALAQTGGTETVTLTTPQIPSHPHVASCNAGGQPQQSPKGAFWASYGQNQYTDQALPQAMNGNALGLTGGGQAHDNRMPFEVINFILSLYGVYPSQ